MKLVYLYLQREEQAEDKTIKIEAQSGDSDYSRASYSLSLSTTDFFVKTA